MYLDRMLGTRDAEKFKGFTIKALPQLACSNCKEIIGIPILYKKESRPAYRLFVGSVIKKIVNSKKATAN